MAARSNLLILLLVAAVMLVTASGAGGVVRRSVRGSSSGSGSAAGRAHLIVFEGVDHAAKALKTDPGHWLLQGAGDPSSAGGENSSGSPFDDEPLDSTLAFSLTLLAVWACVSALLVAAFVRRERRKALLHHFWLAIDSRPDLKRAVEQAANGLSFPAPPRHSVLRRLLRATGLALVVTLGLNLVLLSAKPAGPPGGDDGDDGSGGANGGGGGNGGGGASGGGDFDSSSLDGSPNPLLGFVFLLLVAASAFLLARGVLALCCSGGAASRRARAQAQAQEDGGGSYAPLPLDASGSGSASGSASGGGNGNVSHAFYVGVPVATPATAPPLTPSSAAAAGQGEQQEGEGPPPPYSAALTATHAAVV